MSISKLGLAILKALEGAKRDATGRHVVYKDAAGLPTIGYGHLVEPGEQFTTLTEAEAVVLLDADCDEAERAVEAVGVPLDPRQFDALVIFAFNIGVSGFKLSTVRRYVQSGHFAGVPAAMAMWCKARSPIDGFLVAVPGLVNRREVEGTLFQDGHAAAWSKGVELFGWPSNMATDL